MKSIYLLLLSFMVLAVVSSCNKPHDETRLHKWNMIGTYKVMSESIEYIGDHGVVAIDDGCKMDDTVFISMEYIVWQNRTEQCSSREYIPKPYQVGLNKLRMNDILYSVEYWDGHRLIAVSEEYKGLGINKERHSFEIQR